MITYIYQKDSTLWAFEGPEEPKYCADFGDVVLICGNTFCRCDSQLKGHIAAMSTARESALPVVNANDVWKHIRLVEITSWWKIDDKGKISDELKPGETIALPGWGLEKIHQAKSTIPCEDDFKDWVTLQSGYVSLKTMENRQAYRLVRSEPEKKPLTVTFYSGKLWHSDKPFPVVPKYDGKDWESKEYRTYLEDCKVYKYAVPRWLSTAYEILNLEVIPSICKTATGWANFSEEKHAHLTLKDGDQITLPDGYGISYRINGPKTVIITTQEGKEQDTTATDDKLGLPWFLQPYTDAYTNIVRPVNNPGCIVASNSGSRMQMEYIVEACNNYASLRQQLQEKDEQLLQETGKAMRYSQAIEDQKKKIEQLAATTEKAARLTKQITAEEWNNRVTPENSAHGDKLKEHIEDTLYSTGRFRPEEASDLTQEILKGVEPSESQEEIKQLREWNEAHKETNKRLHDLMVDAEQRGEKKGWNEALDAVNKWALSMWGANEHSIFTELQKLRK